MAHILLEIKSGLHSERRSYHFMGGGTNSSHRNPTVGQRQQWQLTRYDRLLFSCRLFSTQLNGSTASVTPPGVGRFCSRTYAFNTVVDRHAGFLGITFTSRRLVSTGRRRHTPTPPHPTPREYPTTTALEARNASQLHHRLHPPCCNATDACRRPADVRESSESRLHANGHVTGACSSTLSILERTR